MSGILITADLHLTSNPADEYRWTVFDWIDHEVQVHSVGDLVIVGDLSEKKDNHSAKMVNRLVDRLERLSQVVRVHIVSGNHDYTDPSCPFFGFLKEIPNVRFFQDPISTTIGGRKALFLPHSKKWSEVWARVKGVESDLVFFHQAVEGAANGVGFTFSSNDGAVTRSDLKQFGQATLIAGDVHVPQRIGRVTYCGSPHPVDYGDDFTPRMLLYRNNTLQSIPRKDSIRKLSIHSDNVERVLKRVSKLGIGDMVKIAISLPRTRFYEWNEYRARLMRTCKKRGVVVGGISLKEKKREILIEDEGKAVQSVVPADALRQYCKDKNIPAKFRDDGLQLLWRIPVQQRHVSPGRLRPHQIKLCHFRSFKTKQVFQFQRSGLYRLTGKNEVAPRLGANAAGKSTLWDGLSWILYGRTARGLQATNIPSWGIKKVRNKAKCWGSFTFVKSGIEYTVKRTWGPNALTLQKGGQDPKPIVQDALEGLIGLDYTCFLHVVLMGQFNQFFLDRGPTDKLNIFSQALELDAWVEASEMAKRESKAWSEQYVSIREELSKLKGRMQEIESQSTTIESMLKRRKQGYNIDADKVKKDLLNFKTALLTHSEIHKDLLSRHAKLKSKTAKWERQLKETDRTRSELGIDVYTERLKHLQTKSLHLKGQLKTFTDKCRTCGQKLSPEKAEQEWSKIQSELSEVKENIARLEKTIRRIDRERRKLVEVEQKLVDRLSQLDQAKEDLDKEVSSRIARISNCQGNIVKLEKMQEINTKAYDDLVNQRRELRLKENKLKGKINDQRHALQENQRNFERTHYWVAAFKDVRLWIVESALSEMQVEVNNNLVALGLNGWEVRFEAERATASGSVSRGFNVFVASPESSKPAPWEGWSGGETQRLRIAGSAGFAQLIRSRRGIDPTWEVWDEPTAHVNEEGINDLISFLRDRTEDGRQLWVIDHRSLSFDFDGTTHITKTREHGSVISQIKEG